MDLERDLTAELLRCHLEAGVPLKIHEFRQTDRDEEWLIARAQRAAAIVAANGDTLLYPRRARTKAGQRLPGTAEVFTALVEGVAVAAMLAPGGITFLGVTFVVDPADTEPEP